MVGGVLTPFSKWLNQEGLIEEKDVIVGLC